MIKHFLRRFLPVFCCLLIAACSLYAAPPVVSIATMRGISANYPEGVNAEGVNVTLESSFTISGIVTVSTGIFGKNSFFIQDETAGTNVYDAGKRLQTYVNSNPALSKFIQVGDTITVTGLVWFYNGLLEFIPTEIPVFSTFTRTNYTQPPGFKTVTTRDIMFYGEKYEGQLVKVSSAMIVHGTFPRIGESSSLEILDASGLSCTMRIDDGTDFPLYFSTVSFRGYYLDIVGIVSQYVSTKPYTGGFHLLPRSTADITRLMGAGGIIRPLSGPSISFDRQVFNPYKNQNVTITINTIPGNRMTLRIFDTKGRHIRTIAEYQAGGVNQAVVWDGSDENRNTVPPGIYIIHLESYDPAAGTSAKVAHAVAVGVRLK